MRRITPWNTDWRFEKTSLIPAALPTDWESVELPHTWNARDGQDGGNDYWRGTAVYCKAFPRPALEPGERAILEFQGAAMTAEVYLNGVRLARHEGGYSTFRVDMTDLLAGENLLCVAVNNEENDRVYPQKADFTFYGGLYRPVNLITVSPNHFELCRDGTPGIRVTPVVEGSTAAVTVETWQVGGDAVELELAGQKVTVPNQGGHAQATVTISPCRLWDGIDDPYLYRVTATLLDKGRPTDQVETRFGCRTMRFSPSEGFFLNGRPYPLRGVSRHQDRAGVGCALTLRDHREDVDLICEVGANTVRLAHYQHAQEFYDLCDERGLIVWAEIPYITLHMPNGRQNTLDQMRELITQCYNHPSIACWGLSNEITASGEVTEDLLDNHRALNDLCHRMDPTRPTTMAHAFMLEIDSPLIPIADLASYNLYFGWYLGELEQNDQFFDEYHRQFPDRCIGFSEYGADANPAYQTSAPESGDYSEQYQCVLHEHILDCIDARPYLWATYVWNMFDFAADGRDEGGKHGVNQKGLVTMDRAYKKDAFYLYKAAWSREPFVHICGKNYRDRPEEVTEIKVYSNLPQVSLYKDGVLLGTVSGRRVFTFSVPLDGTHTITARAGTCRDEASFKKVSRPNPAYSMGQRSQIVNWFDKEDFMPGYFSIRDRIGELLAHPQAGPLAARILAMSRAARGDVAKSTENNKNLQAMLEREPLQSLLKRAGDAVPQQEVTALNAALQKIRK